MQQLEYRLKNAAHNIEREMAETIEIKFPNFEILWSKYLMLLTGMPSDPNLRNDTFPNLEEIVMSHFGVLKSLNYIRISKSNIGPGDPYQTYKNIYFHFGLIFDSVDNLLRNILIVQNHLKIIKLDEKIKIPKSKLLSEYNEWIDQKYNNAYNNMIQFGKPILYHPQNNYSFLKILITQKPIRKKYNKFVKGVRDYRNFFIHNPGVDIARNKSSQKLFAIKKEYVDICKHWSDFQKLVPKHPEYFEDPHIIIDNDFNLSLELLNKLWKSLINEMEKIYSHKDFPKIFKKYKRNML